jgi:hypothetical protein
MSRYIDELDTTYSINVLDVLRGKDAVHQREMELIKEYKPQLNTK